MLNVLRAELEREFDVEAIQRVGAQYLGLDPGSLTASTPAEAAALVVEQCALLDSLEALADVIAVERPATARRLMAIRREGFRPAESIGIGSVLGRYTLYAVLGVGPDATVFRARDGDRVVRLRLLRERTGRDRYRVNRYLAAARMSAEVSERWLPVGACAGPVTDRMIVAHDLFDGDPLATRPSQPMRLKEAWPILRRTLTALSKLHARGVVHGAVHANNILIGRGVDSPPVMLLDAGAHFLRSGSVTGGLRLGRVDPVVAAWAAPEQLLGDLPTPRSDVYSFAMLMYALIAGRLPVAAEAASLVQRRLSADPDPLGFLAPHGSVPDELDDIVLRLVDSDPAKRPPDAAAVLELLSAVVSSVSTTPSAVPDVDTDSELELLLAEPTNEARAGILEAAIERGADPRRIADAFVLAAEQLEPDGDSGSHRRRLLVRAGAIYENLVGDVRASELAYRKVLEQDRSIDGAWMALERIYRRVGDYEKLVELLLERRDSLQGHAERARLFLRLGRALARDLGDEAQAIVAFTEAIAEDPSDEVAVRELEALAQGNRAAWRGVVESLANTAAADRDPDRRCQLFMRLGHWQEREIGRIDLALSCYQGAIAADPANEAVLERMAGIYRRAQHWSELAQTLLARASVTVAPAMARDLRAEAAGVMIERGKGMSTAREILEQVLAEDPAHAEAGRFLCRLLLAEGKPREWVAAMESRAEGAIGEARRDLLAELARGQAEQLEDLDGAIATWEQVLEESSSDLEALRALEDAYVRAGRPAKAVAVLEQQLSMALTPRQRVSLLERIAKISERDLLDDVAASDALERLLDVDPDQETALASLADVYRRLRNWEALSFTLERRGQRSQDPAHRIAALLELGSVAVTHLEDSVRALAAYEQVLALDASNRAALDAAASLRAEVGDLENAAAAVDQIAEQEREPAARATAWIKAAQAWRRQGDADAALERYRRALEAVPGHAAAAREMAFTLVGQREVSSAVTALEHALARAVSSHDKAEIGAALARVLLDEQKEAGRAGAAVAVALGHDPTNAAVHAVAGELAHGAGKFADAATHFEKACLHLERFDEAMQLRLLSGQIEALARADRPEDARRRLSVLMERAGSRRDAMELVARVAFEVESPERALELTDALLGAHEAALPIDQLAAALHKKGELLRRLGRAGEAVEVLKRSASVDRQSTAPLCTLVELHREAGRTEELRETVETLLSRISPAGDADLIVQMGDVAAEALSDQDMAARAYLSVLAARPEDRKTLLRLMRLYSDGQDWNKLTEVILKLAGLTADRAEKARYVQMAARVSEKELGDTKQAAELYDVALKLDPNSEGIVSRALALHSQLGDTAQVRQILEQQIERASASQDRDRAYRLATALADLDLGELQVDDAIAINEAALKLVAADQERENVLADLYMTDAKRYLHRAARLQRRIVARDPRRPEPYRRLRQLGIGANRLDTAWCACQALTALQKASADEESYFSEHRGGSLLGDSGRLSDPEWSDLLVHADANPTLTSLLIQIHPVVASTSKGVSLEALGLDEKAALSPRRCDGTLVKAFERAADLLRSPMPLLFEQPQQKVAVMLGQGARAHVLLSSAGAHKPFSERKAAFIAASSSVLLRPGYLLRVLLTPMELKAWVLGAIRLVVPKFNVAKEIEEAVDATHKQLSRHLPAPIKQRIGGLLDAMLAASGHADLTRWTGGVDLTADRAGLLMSNDLSTALSVIRASGDSGLSQTVAERTNALLEFAVSSEYLRLRNSLAVSVDRSELEELEASDIAPIT